jgi:hypothetical protein
MRFNYITSAALDSGLAISTILLVLTISLTNTDAPNWWGNVGIYNTMDYLGTAVAKIVPDGTTFGLLLGSEVQNCWGEHNWKII